MKSVLILLVIAMIVVIRNCKKILRTILVALISILAVYCMIFCIDQNRIENGKKPIFAKEIIISDTKREFKGLGYSAIEEFEVIDGEEKINKMEMYFLNKCVAGVVNDYNYDGVRIDNLVK